jgi:uncharacterized protein (DUF1810 family)
MHEAAAKDRDPYRLERFVAAQDRGGTYERALAELRAGAKVSHWMWFVFPQVAGLGLSAMAREFAISSVAEARAYLAHPVLGPRLRECARVVAQAEGKTAERIFGPVDAMKLRSSMTLFEAADPAEAGRNVFRAVLAKYFGGVPDEATLARLLRVYPTCGTSTAAPNRLVTCENDAAAEAELPSGTAPCKYPRRVPDHVPAPGGGGALRGH